MPEVAPEEKPAPNEANEASVALVPPAPPEPEAASSPPSQRGWVYAGGSGYLVYVSPQDTGDGTAPLDPTLGIGGELLGGLSPALRAGLFLDLSLGGLRTSSFGDRFKKSGNELDNYTFRVGIRARTTPVPLAGVLPFLDLSAGIGFSRMELTEEKCQRVNGEPTCEDEVIDEASFGGSILGVGLGVEVDMKNPGNFKAYSAKSPPSPKFVARAAYNWYAWSGSDPTDETGAGPDLSVDRQMLELSLGVTYW